jgi:hypothetical protein
MMNEKMQELEIRPSEAPIDVLCEEPKQVNYLWELYAAQERRKQNRQPAEEKEADFDPLSALAGVQR